MFKHILQLAAISCLLVITNFVCAGEDARNLARDAFYAISEDPFDAQVLKQSLLDIKKAEQADPKEAWVAIAKSRALLEIGYRKGNRYNINSYSPKAISSADELAQEAVSLDPNESLAYSQLANVQIILRNYKGAWETLNQAHNKNPDDFHPWYLRGVISLKMKDPEKAASAFDEAGKHAKKSYQSRILIQQRINLAKLTDNKQEEEQLYLQSIELAPRNAHAYGNYGSFLFYEKRYDEAIANLEKAIAISPYPLAEDLLERAKLLKKSASQ